MNIADRVLEYSDTENAKKYYVKGNDFADKLIAKDSSERNMKIWLRGNYNLGVAFGYEGNVEKEIELATKTIPIAERMGDKFFVANGNTNLAVKYSNLTLFDQAYEMFEISQKQFQEIGAPEDIIYHSLTFATCLANMDSLARMKSVLDVAKVNLDKIPNSFYQGNYYGELGLYYGMLGEYENSLKALDKSYEFYGDKKSNYYLKLLYQRYSDIYEKMGDFKNAKAFTMKYLNFYDDEHSSEDIAGSYYRLANHEAGLNNFRPAYNYLKEYITALDSARIGKLGNDLQKLEIQYRTATKEKEILALKNEKNEANLLKLKRV